MGPVMWWPCHRWGVGVGVARVTLTPLSSLQLPLSLLKTAQNHPMVSARGPRRGALGWVLDLWTVGLLLPAV
jgi:hypothetical protein